MDLAHLVRGELIESIHRGHLVIASRSGSETFGSGSTLIYPRSAVKPIQAAAMVAEGLDLPDRLLALAAASHSGDVMHREGAEEILGSVGLDPTALQCPADLPYGARERMEWTKAGHGKAAIAHNCSGKHAAMIATSAINGWPIESYRDPAHPLQQRIAALLEQLSGEAIRHVTVDGCGAPLFALSVSGLANAISGLVRSDDAHCRRVVHAIRMHPEMVAGVDRSTTLLMQAVPDFILKEGAEGVQIGALLDGRAFAIKVEDGSMRALPVLTQWVLERWGVSSDRVGEICATPVLGGGLPVGVLRPAL